MHAMDVDTAEALAGVVGYFDRQRFALGLPRVAQGLDRLDSSSLSVSTWPPTRPGTWSRTALTWARRCPSVANRPAC
jgi:hypothetical protein